MALSALSVQKAKVGPKPYKLTDQDGLYLLVNPTGSKLWRWDYRFRGKRKTLALGAYPDVSLGDARTKHEDARKALREGVDPAAIKRAKTVGGETFEAVAKHWFDGRSSGWAPITANRIWLRLKLDAIPRFGAKPVSQVTPDDVLGTLRQIEARGSIETARRVRTYVERIFKTAAALGHVERGFNPAAGLVEALSDPKPKVHRARLKSAEVGDFMVALDRYDGESMTRDALLLTILTWARTGEIRFAAASEFEGLDTDQPIWRIPASRMKMRNEHLVPLPRQAVPIVKRWVGSGYLFPCNTRSKVISENRMLYACYRLGYAGRATVHGFRGTASTWANEGNWNRDWIERQLAHVEENEVRGAYNSAEYLGGRRTLLQAWADWLDLQRDMALLI